MNSIAAVQDKNISSIKEGSPVYYLLDFGLFGTEDVNLFCSYKHFIENIIVELGDDWRIQSGLLSNQIDIILKEELTQKKLNSSNEPNLQFNIFNEFLLPFLKDKIGNQKDIFCQNQTDVQDLYAKSLEEQFDKNIKIVDSLTFKTLSLGFCITAIDQWQQSFDSIKKDTLRTVELSPLGVLSGKRKNSFFNNQFQFQSKKQEPLEFRSCHLSHSEDFKKSSENYQHYWRKLEDLSFVSKSQARSLITGLKKMKNEKNKIISFGNFATNLCQVNMKGKKIRIISIYNEFYKRAFIVWLIFNIKLFFTLNFEQYLIYFKKLCSSWTLTEHQVLPLKKFFLIIDREWNLLLKDYSVALHDDLEVVKKLIEKVRKEYENLWATYIKQIKHRFPE